jgi:serine phosphatase RsbU (regulator of sigma subunit)
MPGQRADSVRNREAIIQAGARLLSQSPTATLAEVAAAAGVARSTVYRHFKNRDELDATIARRPAAARPAPAEELLSPGRLGRDRPVALDALAVFDAVSPPVLPGQLVAEAERIANVPVALYVLDIDGSHLLRVGGPERLPERIEAPLAVGPELDADGLASLRERLRGHPGAQIVPLWLRGRATGVMITLAQTDSSLTEIARHAAAAISLAARYTDTFTRAQRRKQPTAAAEIQQSLLPPRIARVTGGEVAGNVLPSYEVGGDWFDVVENLDGVWMTLADGLGGATRATASAAVALGALRSARRSGASIAEALIVMHTTLKEMPGPRAEMTAVATRWDPADHRLAVANCGHIPPIIVRGDGSVAPLPAADGRGLGGRARPRPAEFTVELSPGDRAVLVSDGVLAGRPGRGGLGREGVVEAALGSSSGAAAETVRRIHTAVLEKVEGELEEDATVVCLSVG